MAALVVAGVNQAIAAEPIKVGAVLSLTGGAAPLGEPEAQTLQMMVDETNKAGGLLGRRVALIQFDDGSDPGKANGFVKRLIEDEKVDMLIGGTTTGATMAMYSLVERAEIPFISLGGARVIVDPVKKWLFKVSHDDRMASERALQDMAGRGYKSIALLADTTGYGQSSRKETLAVAGKYGVSIIADETFNVKDTDVTAQLAKIKNNPAVQALFVSSFGQGPIVVAKGMAQLGMTLPHYEGHGSASQEYLNLTGAASEGVRMPSPAVIVAQVLPDSDPQKALSAEYAKAFEARFKTPPSTFGAYARDAWLLWVNAVTRAGSTDKAKVRDALENTKDFPDTSGIVTMSPQDHLGIDSSGLKMVQIKNGGWTLAK
ncbi:branched-chain amino acid ABC transporter, periplasmic ligand-binding component [Paramagnetospirillum caucaseum]|uniref:Branched-chain amino acid ABC transporter, periplasmic ligand-binding component n=1 Tax=Paramagnetospirillum caucaseum TaxID=1244869 RepID=M2Z4H7_9PROT|nr:branched-chain amino acid ABC transporter, periplasmic ligand-binding component [Paramagnetospirillum caucaseum]